MGHKKPRLVMRLLHAARTEARYRDTHVFIGGTGAVGGTALFQMLSIYEEMMSIRKPKPDDVPVLMATGASPDEIKFYTKRLYQFIRSQHGDSKKPRPKMKKAEATGYLTHSGIFVALERFKVNPFPELETIGDVPVAERPMFMRDFITSLGKSGTDFDILMESLSETRLMSEFLKRYRLKLPKDRQDSPFRSVIIGIPFPSIVAYHLGYLWVAASYLEGVTPDRVDKLKRVFRDALCADLNEIKTSLAEEVLLAHTTAIGGMYNEEVIDGRPVRTYRLGFSHSAQDDKLVEKQKEAEEFANEFAALNIKVLITAAAIGIDEVRIREPIPLHKDIRQKLRDAPEGLFRKRPETKPTDSKKAKEAGISVQAKRLISVYHPLEIPLESPPAGPAVFEYGKILYPSYSIRSGENGFFSVSNADALYRVMRVASASELGQVMATVALFGDDPHCPWFPGSVCYYTEGDNSRQVFDLLNQPRLLETQLSGLEPLALQDLGSSKHQGELHTLSLLILLHRLRTFDIEAIDPYVDSTHFDATRFLLEHSRPLTFEDLEDWDDETIAKEMQILAWAETFKDLAELNPSRHAGLFEEKDKAADKVLERVLEAVRMIPSLGSPILFEREGTSFIRTGYYVAPLDLLITETNAIDRHLKNEYDKHCERFGQNEDRCTFEEFRDFHICSGGFVDLRPKAILCTAKNSNMPLKGKVLNCSSQDALREELRKLEPYSIFTTCGLTALLFRLRGLYSQLRQAMVELGTLHEYRWQMPRDTNGHILLVPGGVEAFRMFSEGLEKTTGTERLDGIWGYERREPIERWNDIPGITS